MIFNYEENILKEDKAIYTLKEIAQQPSVILKIYNLIKKQKQELSNFFEKIVFSKKNTKIIFTGAGTSEFIGNSIVHQFTEKGYNCESVATTNIVQNIEGYINPNENILLISLARSGNSPESVATFNMMNKYCKKINNIIITCNKEGELAKINSSNNSFLIELPEEANDKSFAMTSSFSGMLICSLLLFDFKELEAKEEEIKNLSKNIDLNMNLNIEKIKSLTKNSADRIVFIGSGDLNGIAQESHLKVLELTAGIISAFYNTPLGFRHGPKSIVNKNTMIVFLLNKDSYKRQYDLDLLFEIKKDGITENIVVLDSLYDENIESNFKNYLVYKNNNENFLGINYVTFAQLLAFFKSLELNLTPDNPCPTGEVNRVVKGVIIHTKQNC